MDRTGSLTLTIDSRLEHVFLIGLTVNKLCSSAALSELETYQVELSVVEAVNNAIEHGYGCEPGHPVEVRITVEKDSLSFAVSDHGITMPADASPARLTRSADADLAEGGRGLLIMQSFMDAVIYERQDGRNVRTLVKRRVLVHRGAADRRGVNEPAAASAPARIRTRARHRGRRAEG